jgi:hypothetical protein
LPPVGQITFNQLNEFMIQAIRELPGDGKRIAGIINMKGHAIFFYFSDALCGFSCSGQAFFSSHPLRSSLNDWKLI